MTTTTTGLPAISEEMKARLEQMPPEQRARLENAVKNMTSGTPQTHTYKVCLTKEKLNSNPFTEGNAKECTWTELNSTGTKLDAQGTCVTGSEKMKSNITMHVTVVDSEHVKGTGKVAITNGSNTMNSGFEVSGKYLGADCGDTK